MNLKKRYSKEDYIGIVEKVADYHKINIVLSDDKLINGCNGYFDSVTRTLSVAKGNPDWFPIFVHESCHMDQYIDQCPEWLNCFVTPKIEAIDLIFLWIQGKIGRPEQLDKYIQVSKEVELDCEKRTVAIAELYNLELGGTIEEYIQKSNAYIWFYDMVKLQKKWYTEGKEPYRISEVWKSMPTTFENDYSCIPYEFKVLYLKYCF